MPNVILLQAGSRTIDVIKTVSQVAGLGLSEAKTLVERVPSTIKSGIGANEAERIKAKLLRVGAKVEIA
ncbi:MAG: ribosomal protein bL12 [Vulcanimicrobiaceae bacterium]